MKSIIRGNRKGTCFLCSRLCLQTEEHHIFGGKNRKLSERYGLKVYLCPYCHRDNKGGVHGNAGKMEHLQRIGQAAFERNHTREEFVDVFGKNYLPDPEEEKPDRQQAPPDLTGFITIPDGITGDGMPIT